MTSFLTHAGYLALIIFAFVEACSIPISSEITFGVAGVLAYEGHLSLPLVIIIGSLAELAGSYTSYAIGRKGGRPTVDRWGKYALLTRKDVDRAERFFAGRGAWSVAVARVIPLVRAFAGLVSGLIEVPALQFGIFNAIGTVVWATALSVAGYELGSDWHKVEKNLSYAGYGIVVLLILGLVAHKWHQVRQEKATAVAAGPGGASPTSTAPPADSTPADAPHGG